ncbi:MAG: hypothetical protein DRN05_02990, partial [Thermoplasmata archaeon]
QIKQEKKNIKLAKELKNKCEKLGIKFKTDIFYPKKRKNSICASPFYKLFFNSNGYTTPCPIMPHFNLIKTTDIMEAWNSKEMLKFRRRIIKGDYPKWCRDHCGY